MRRLVVLPGDSSHIVARLALLRSAFHRIRECLRPHEQHGSRAHSRRHRAPKLPAVFFAQGPVRPRRCRAHACIRRGETEACIRETVIVRGAVKTYRVIPELQRIPDKDLTGGATRHHPLPRTKTSKGDRPAEAGIARIQTRLLSGFKASRSLVRAQEMR